MLTTEDIENGTFYTERGEETEFSDLDYDRLGKFEVDGVLYDWEFLDSTGGMDQGSNASRVFRVGNQVFRKSGYYASHYGYDWDGNIDEVEPVLKTITVWETK